jgi:hypothetical protein
VANVKSSLDFLKTDITATRNVMHHGYVTHNKKDDYLMVLHCFSSYLLAMGQVQKVWRNQLYALEGDVQQGTTRAPLTVEWGMNQQLQVCTSTIMKVLKLAK